MIYTRELAPGNKSEGGFPLSGRIPPGVTWGLIPLSLTEQALSCEK
jgi:hypothetical protein